MQAVRLAFISVSDAKGNSCFYSQSWNLIMRFLSKVSILRSLQHYTRGKCNHARHLINLNLERGFAKNSPVVNVVQSTTIVNGLHLCSHCSLLVKYSFSQEQVHPSFYEFHFAAHHQTPDRSPPDSQNSLPQVELSWILC